MENYICKTCGTQFAKTEMLPSSCPICEDSRQYVGWEGQQWTNLRVLQQTYHNEIKPLEPSLAGIGTQPSFAIGQRALLVQAPAGNILWDCISLLDESTIKEIEALGGISAIAVSHPHFYSSMVEWSKAFDAPVYIHADDREWVMRPDPNIHFWEGDTMQLMDGMTLIRLGGHFKGSTVLHWREGAERRGALLSGDTLQVVSDRRHVSFMYSFPNLIPLSAKVVRGIGERVDKIEFDRIYGAWWGMVVDADAKAAVSRSVERYMAALES
ncbi:MAG: hypothetical protein JXA25_06660 [Anaerolineales bacterium]|nr:hypothetical protein [Anaerolineales bacterium]